MLTRMNIGGPAYHVSILSGRLDPERYETRLVVGRLGPGEGSFAELADRYGVEPETVGQLRPEIRPLSDLKAVVSLARTIRAFRPDIVHTHTAKAGAIGRLAVVLAGSPRPIVVHTFHGHVLDRFFGPVRTAAFRYVERALARVTDCVVGVSEATVDDLVKLGVAPRSKCRVVRLGLDLERFDGLPRAGRVRRELGIGDDETLAIFCGRLVPTKRVDVMLRAIASARAGGVSLHVAIVGDGALRADLERLAARLGIDESTHFLGFRKDVDALLAEADFALLTSDSEGTPVFLIEAAAARVPAVATDVDGVRTVVDGGGLLVPRGDSDAVAEAVSRLADDRPLRESLGEHARRHVLSAFSSGRLVADVDALYTELLERRSARQSAA